MDTFTRTAFEAKLKELGYGPIAPLDYGECPHTFDEPWTVYTMPTADCFEHPTKTYGDLGWLRFVGCKECCMEVSSVIFCGGLYEHTRIFQGETDVTHTTNLGVSELQHASDLLEE